MSALPQDSLFETLPIGHLEAQLDGWVDSFPVDAIRLHLEELERQRGTIEAAVESLTRRLQIWEAMRAHQAGREPSKKPSKRDAVLNLLERDTTRELALAEIRAEMIAGGLLEDTPKARHALEATVSNMVKRGEISRPRKGFYKFGPQEGASQAARRTNVHCQDGEAW